jgi:acetyltransferase-like isoleucine patch superfamily enzyme
MRTSTIIKRFFIPSWLISIIYFAKYRCFISPRAEVELNPNLVIGKHSQISSFTKIKASYGPLVIGKNVSIGAGCQIGSGSNGTHIGDNCLISPHVIILGGNFQYDQIDVPIREHGHISKGTKISSNVWIGAGTCVLDGSEIGSGAIITPNSVVSNKIPANAIAQGSPAKPIFFRR